MPTEENETPVTSLSDVADGLFTPQHQEEIEMIQQERLDEFDERVKRLGLDKVITYNARLDPGEPWPTPAEFYQSNKKKRAP